MFIRETYKKIGGEKRYSYLTLVESFLTPKGPRQRVILSLGNIELPKKFWPTLVEMIGRRLAGQGTMLPEPKKLLPLADRVVERIRRKGKFGARGEDGVEEVQARISGIQVEEPRVLGPVHVAEHFWNALKMGAVLKECGLSGKDILCAKIEIFGRLIAPMSENATVKWVERMALGDLMGEDLSGVRRDALYRFSDKLIKQKERIEGLVAEKEASLFRGGDTIYLYDLTSTYFEGLQERNPKARRGHSRDGRPDCKQIVVGLILDREGFVKAHELYEGNRQDITTVESLVTKLQGRVQDPSSHPTVIIDRGMASEENLRQIRERGMRYIVAARQTERDKYLEVFGGVPLREVEKKSKGTIKVVGKEINGEVYILCRSEQRESKDRAIRERFQKRIEEALGRLQRAIEGGKLKDLKKIEQRIGRIKERNHRVSRYYRIETNEVNGVVHLLWGPKEGTERERYDGTYLLRTNRQDLQEEEIWRLYILLTRVERAFRNLKTDLGIRPIHHQKELRVDGHIFISVLAYHFLHAIEHTLRSRGDRRSWHTIKQILGTHQVVTVVLPDADGQHVHHVRLATEPEAEQKEIYEKLRVNPRPITRKRITIKKEDL